MGEGLKLSPIPLDEKPTHELVRNRLSNINPRIGDLIAYRSHTFGPETKKCLRQLHAEKNYWIIQGFCLRKEGDENISFELVGTLDEGFPLPRNDYALVLNTPELWPRYFWGYLGELRRHYVGDIRQLIGKPDVYLPESNDNRLERTFREMRDVNEAIDPGDPNGSEKLTGFQLMLAKRALTIRVEGILEGKILVGFTTESHLIQMRLIRPGRRDFECQFPYHESLERLVKQGGGYDYQDLED